MLNVPSLDQEQSSRNIYRDLRDVIAVTIRKTEIQEEDLPARYF
jgi:hypothetical protein